MLITVNWTVPEPVLTESGTNQINISHFVVLLLHLENGGEEGSIAYQLKRPRCTAVVQAVEGTLRTTYQRIFGATN
jgi:hypothetical protein